MPSGKTQKIMSTGKTLLGVLLGFAAGAAVGVLLAPRSGKETREILRKKGEHFKDELDELLDSGFEKWRMAKNRFVERAHMTKEDIKDFLQFMAEEGADLKERVKRDIKGDGRTASASSARHTADQVINN